MSLSNEVILTIAQAILKNTEVLQTLVNALPQETKIAIEEKVTKVVKNSPVPVVKQEVVDQVVTTPVVVEVPNVQPAPIPVDPATVTPTPVVSAPVTPVAASPSNGMTKTEINEFTMKKYKELGPIKGAAIQEVLDSLGCKNINNLTPDQYAAFVAGVEAL